MRFSNHLMCNLKFKSRLFIIYARGPPSEINQIKEINVYSNANYLSLFKIPRTFDDKKLYITLRISKGLY